MSERIPIVAIFISPIFKLNEIFKGETDIKEFPLYQIIFKYIISVILFSVNWKHDLNEKIILKEVYSHILLVEIGLFGFILSSSFLIYYIYHYFQKDIHKVIQYITFFIIWSIMIIFICSFFIKIPIISNLVIVISYTILTLSPFSQYKEIYLNKDFNLIGGFDLWALFYLNIYLLIENIRIGFTYLLILFLVNSLISLIEICFFIFLYYLSKMEKKESNIDEHLIESYYKKQNDNQGNEYHPPTMKDDVTDLV